MRCEQALEILGFFQVLTIMLSVLFFLQEGNGKHGYTHPNSASYTPDGSVPQASHRVRQCLCRTKQMGGNPE